MPQLIEVTCIVKTNRQNPHERIQSIGGRNSDGSQWMLPEGDAIVGIESGKWSFFVSQNGRRVNVIIEKSAAGNKYLKTEADGVVPNNLLSLSACPL